MYDAFILNPIAGAGRAVRVMEQLEGLMKERNLPCRVFRTEYPAHATELARELSQKEKVSAVISVGGDGTAFEVASGLAGTGKPMGIIPAGTGNDFIKTAGIPREPDRAMETILQRNTASVDMGTLNDGSFLNVCGTGFDVTVLDYTEKFKTRFHGLLPYLLGLINAIFHYRPVHVRLRVDGVWEESDVLVCSVANGRFIGGGIPICPVAEITDGKLDLVTVRSVPRRRIPLYLPGLLMGKILGFRIASHRLADEVIMEGNALRVNVDGEIFSMDRVRFSIQPGVLTLLK